MMGERTHCPRCKHRLLVCECGNRQGTPPLANRGPDAMRQPSPSGPLPTCSICKVRLASQAHYGMCSRCAHDGRTFE